MHLVALRRADRLNQQRPHGLDEVSSALRASAGRERSAPSSSRRGVLAKSVGSSLRRRLLAGIASGEIEKELPISGWTIGRWSAPLPQWFKEGLAVMVSGGGGAEGVSESQARDAIRRGDHIALATSNSLLNLGVIRYVQSPEIPDTAFRTLMAYRQAGCSLRFSTTPTPPVLDV
jgi:hypothetical protein